MRGARKLKNELLNIKKPGLAGFENAAISLLASPGGIQFSNEERASGQRSNPGWDYQIL